MQKHSTKYGQEIMKPYGNSLAVEIPCSVESMEFQLLMNYQNTDI